MKIPFFNELQDARTVLLAGAGGGFDIFCGLPLYFSLRNAGKVVHLANLSFTELAFCDAKCPVPSLFEITPSTAASASYFPEVHLSRWLSDRFGPTPVYGICRSGVRPTAEAYEWLAQNMKPDALVLIDGGTDSLLRGDEAGLGTPQEDMASLAAAHSVGGVARKFLISIGFGVDSFHGVCHAQILENVAALIADDGFLGSWSVTRQMEEFRLYREACDFVAARIPRQPSIVNTSIISAIDGRFGNYHATKRTEGSNLFINPLMAIYWAFRLENVAQRNLYLDRIQETRTYHELSMVIETFRATLEKVRPWSEIPC